MLLVGARPATATITGDNYEVQARISVQNAFHHDNAKSIQWVQERNELRFDLKYDLVPTGKPFAGLVSKARFNMLYRARYDSVFDARDSYKRRQYNRDDFRFPEGEYPRELFFDFEFQGLLRPVGIRLGRQQIVWGEADLFRSLDVVNPLRLDQVQLVGEDFSDYREPIWAVKLLWDIGAIGHAFEGAGIEAFYTPNSRPITNRLVIGESFRIGLDQNNPLTGFTRRNSLPFRQVRYPWELTRVGHDYGDAQDFAELGPPLGNSDFVYLINNDTSHSVVSLQQSAGGVRFLGRGLAGIDFTFNYIFKRAELPGTALMGRDLFDPGIATNGSFNARLDLFAQALAAAAIPGGNEELIRRCVFDHEPLFVLASIHGTSNASSGCLRAKFWYPWTHIVGITATYNDNDVTGAVFRAEESISTKEPRNGVPPLAGPRRANFPTARDFATNGMRDTMVWRSMIGFDYLRSIGLRAARNFPAPFNSLLGQDQWLISMQFFDEYYSHYQNQIGLGDSVTDREQQFNPLLTLVATGFFSQQRLRPLFAAGYDINAKFPFLQMQAEYNVGRRWSIRVGDALWMGSKHAESFLLFNRYADRDNFFVRVTYFLL